MPWKETLQIQHSFQKLNKLGSLCQGTKATENRGKEEKSATSLSALKESTSSENWENGKMAKIKKSPAFPKLPLSSCIVTNSQRKVSLSLSSVKAIAKFLLKESKAKQMAVHFVGKEKITSLHGEYFEDQTPTDCITFPYEDSYFLGEIFICPQVAAEYVATHGGSLEEEITLYLVHGYLHLRGLRDKTSKEKREMRKEEKKWLNRLAKNSLTVKISSG